ncbi:MAG: inositol monophosphatase, partial [Sphingomonadaceae bacterium]|nr:inositol monophosphatase [Sphingomonadaceae bacterium]
MHPLDHQVSTLLRDVAADVVLPRFRALRSHEIFEKSPGDMVTIVDGESEARLGEGLAALLPDARIVAEEACSADATLLEGLGKGVAWLIDPLDGTTNFSEGITPFALMVALLVEGEAEAGWIYDPVTKRMCHAQRGAGAFVDGERIAGRSTGAPLPVAALAMHFLSPERRAD